MVSNERMQRDTDDCDDKYRVRDGGPLPTLKPTRPPKMIILDYNSSTTEYPTFQKLL